MIKVIGNYISKVLYIFLFVVVLYCLVLGAVFLFHLRFRFELVNCLSNCSQVYLVGASPKITTWNGISLAQINLDYADLSGANIRNSDLSGMDLFQVNLQKAILNEANLSNSRLIGIDLGEANLTGVDLRHADLSRARLDRANLNEVNLEDANLQGADLRGAILTKANLRKANLFEADLRGATLQEVNLEQTNFCETQLDDGMSPIDNKWYLFKKCTGQVLFPLTSCQEAVGLIGDQGTFVCMRSEKDNWAGGGYMWLFTPRDVKFSVERSKSNRDTITIRLVDKDDVPLSMRFSPPRGEQLKLGTYEIADDPSEAGLMVAVEHRASDASRFEILEIEYDPAGNIKRFAANFEQHWNGSSAPTLFGYVRFNSKVPL